MNRTLAVEYVISLSIVSWAAIKNKKLPWPPSIMYVSVAYAILSFASLLDENFANALGTGFLLAVIIKATSDTPSIPNFVYNNLQKDGWFQGFSVGFDGQIGAE